MADQADDVAALLAALADQLAQDAPPVADLPFALTAEVASDQARQQPLFQGTSENPED